MAIRVRKLHKWTGLAIGLILFLWTTTGMILSFHAQGGRATAQVVDYAAATLSPAEATRIVLERGGTPGPMREVQLVTILGRPTYRVQPGRGPAVLLDAGTGQPMVIDRDLAQRIAREGTGGFPVNAVTRLGAHSLDYPNGPLPVFRIALDDPGHTVAFVSLRDGALTLSTRRNRLRGLAAGLHDFGLISLLVRHTTAVQALLLVCGTACLGMVLTGYWIWLPRRRRSQPLVRRQANAGQTATI